jgi:hypothetical protein
MYQEGSEINLEVILKQYLNGEKPHYEPAYLKITKNPEGLIVCDLFGNSMRL